MDGLSLFAGKILLVIALVYIGQTICYAAGRKALAKATFLTGILLGSLVLLQGLQNLQTWIDQKAAPVKNAAEKIEKFNKTVEKFDLWGDK